MYCLYIWTKFDSIMISGSWKCPLIYIITSEDINSRPREDIVKPSPMIK